MDAAALRQKMINIIITADAKTLERLLRATADRDEPARYLSTKAAASAAGISTRTLARYARDGKITPVRLSARKLRWDEAEISRFLSEGID